MRIPGITVTDPEALRNWIESSDHYRHCAAYGEGQSCCLDLISEVADANTAR